MNDAIKWNTETESSKMKYLNEMLKWNEILKWNMYNTEMKFYNIIPWIVKYYDIN